MKQIRGAILFAGLILLTVPATAQPAPHAGENSSFDCSSTAAMEWLVGVWETSGGRTIFSERWVRLSANTFEGVGRVLDADSRSVASEESLRLVGMGSGLFYLAKVEHNELPIAFAARECSQTHVVFENRSHDFPKRIVYRRVDADHVTVDVDDGNGQGFSLAFERIE